jgi:hypothetical protein
MLVQLSTLEGKYHHEYVRGVTLNLQQTASLIEVLMPITLAKLKQKYNLTNSNLEEILISSSQIRCDSNITNFLSELVSER